ncbi:MAG: WecB/TagA/CpsF family glycosyltransferase [Nitrospira sp.]|nr:WecB/TagA/CpsF family glycosyltransferase [Nitrospira sp.]
MSAPLSSGKNHDGDDREVGVLLGIPIDRKALRDIVQESVRAIEHRIDQRVFACANPHSLVVAQQDLTFQAALQQADVLVVDGVGALLMARLIGVPLGPRITGSDYFHGVLNALQQRGSGRIFFFGSSQHVLDRIAKRFAVDFPSLTLCGMFSPPFGEWTEMDNHRMVKLITDARPDVLWVGMTAPKQEKWVEANRRKLNVPVIGSIGAVFDFYAGTYARAPQWICRIGLEWAYRFMLEPRRMWRRNFVSAPTFIWLVLRRHVFGGHAHVVSCNQPSSDKSHDRGQRAA